MEFRGEIDPAEDCRGYVPLYVYIERCYTL